jgi:hypothetical protein
MIEILLISLFVSFIIIAMVVDKIKIGGIKMKLIEKIAESVHNSWWNEKKEQGFHSPDDCKSRNHKDFLEANYEQQENVRNPKFFGWCEKCHTDMYPYNELPENIKEYDRVTAKAVLKSLEENDYSVIKDEDIPDTATGTFIGDDSEWRRY